MSSSNSNINALLKKTEHYDKDERYMATSDLCEVLKRHASRDTGGSSSVGSLDSSTERRICTAVLRLLHDKSNDVQAIAVKTLGVLLTTVGQEQVLEIADSLADQVLDASKSELRDVYAIGLRTLVKTIPQSMGHEVSKRLVGRLLEGIRTSDNQEIVLACLDILTDLLGRFGATALSVTRQHEPILQMCLTQLGAESPVVRKRAGNTIGCLSVVLSDALLTRMVQALLGQIDRAEQQPSSGKEVIDTRALIRTMCTVSGAVGHRLGQGQIDRILPIFLKFTNPEDAATGDDDDDGEGANGGDDDAAMEDPAMSQDSEDETAMALKNELRESCFMGFESFVLRCPTEVEPHLDNIVRRSAIRALKAVVEAKKHDPSTLWSKSYPVRKSKSSIVATALVNRFKEREENCRVGVIDCFTRLLDVTVAAAHSGVIAFADPNAMDTTANSASTTIDLRNQYAPQLVKACEKLLSVKKGGERSKSNALMLLSTLCTAPGGVGGGSEVASVFQHVQTFLATNGDQALHREGTSKALRLDALSLVRAMLVSGNHDPVHIQQGLRQSLLPELCEAVKEQWYKVIAEALRALAAVPRFFIVGWTDQDDEASQTKEKEKVASHLYVAIEPLLSAHDVDQEIKECALKACASLLSSLHSSLKVEQKDRLLQLLLERLKNETTRIAAIKTISAIAASSGSPGVGEEDAMDVDRQGKIDLSPILVDSISTMASFLKLQSRSLKQSSLEALDTIVTNHGSAYAELANGELYAMVLQELAPLVVDSDLHLSHLSLRAAISVLKECPACGPAVKAHVLPNSLVLSTSPLLQDLALDSLLALLEQIVLSNAVEFSDLLVMLRERLKEEKIGKHAIYNLAKCIAIITATTTPENRQGVVDETLVLLDKAETPDTSAELRRVQLALLVSGDLGRMVDLSTLSGGVAERLQKIYMEYFLSSSEDLKHAAAFSLGRASVGSQSVFLPVIVNTMDEKNQKKQYLLLSALREYIKCSFHQSGGDGIAPSLPVVLPHLEAHCKEEEEGVRTMVAECLGSLTCMQPDTMLKKLSEIQSAHMEINAPGGVVPSDDTKSKENSLVCWTVATSLKLAIAGKVDSTELAKYMPGYLKLLQQKELHVRNAALLMTYSAVHHMPQVVSGLMKDEIMPSLYDVAELKLERIVDLGPFKHTVDDALPLRKAALSIFATCLEKLPASMDIAAFMPVLAKSLGDVEDIQLHAHHILISMCLRQPTYLVAAIETFVEPLEKTIHKKAGQKTGTELERLNDWIKSSLRAMLALSRLDGAMNARKFAEFHQRTTSNSKFRPVLDALEGDTTS
ncbi:Cullin-associated NEDD8-dissociated protein [Seminavis robusta]|uniref:Cullin-associated NEDD8-dissociated protein n=1 Tax=Seminavis robusta TaxID=568900 RepID=A0A9N8H1C3_9STRA|nr:Cullin-associated NEDD8-dissociated protein [Seminavis robusta]|eukprot:Sro2_g001430.1 Cullin-associated NEDD8-dissociated protein (1314) ;mRNA; f:148347-152573